MCGQELALIIDISFDDVVAILRCRQFMESFIQFIWPSGVVMVYLMVFVENQILFCVRGSYFFLCFADNCLVFVLFDRAIGGKIYSWSWNNFCAVFLLVSWVHILVWFWGCLGAMFEATRSTWMCVQEIYCHPVVFLVIWVPKCAVFARDILMFVLVYFICVLIKLYQNYGLVWFTSWLM